MPFLDEGFFHALQQEPQDDALRLVFADFLEDCGDEESSARAELIRVQVKLASLSTCSPGAAELIPELTARQTELLARWRTVWLGEWADKLHGCTFRRGMVEAIEADASVFLDNAEGWFGEWPTLTVAKLTRAGDLLPELAGSPWLAHLRGLDLSNNGIDSDGLAWLTASRFICLLEALDLSDNPIGPRGAGLLAATRAAEELRELHLARCGLWQEGMMALLGSPADHRVWRRLDLSGNGLYRLALVRLVDSPLMPQLESLDLAANPLNDNGASALADSPNAAGLVELGLCATGGGDREVAALAHSGNLKKLRSLDLRGCCGGWHRDRNGEDRGGIAELARSPLLGQLRRLLLGSTRRSNGWTAQILSDCRQPRPLELSRGGWMADVLRKSRYLMPSQLAECDLEELWWLGDTSNRERPPANASWLLGCMQEFPELLDQMESRHAEFLRLRFGVNENPKTLKEISERWGMSRDAVRRLEQDAIRKFQELWNRLPYEVRWTGW
jgi:uncharacterized protein (TIGR02996 family)